MASRKLYVQLAVVATTFLLLAGCSFNSALFGTSGFWTRLFVGLLGVDLLILSFVYFWILSCCPSPNQTFKKVTIHFLLAGISRISGKRNLGQFRAACKKPRFHQERCLQQIIKENGDTEYGRKFHLREMKSLEEFRQRHPLTKFEHYRSYVDRMMDGEKNILTKGVPTSYVRTTGTTGKPKYIPYVSKLKTLAHIGNMMVANCASRLKDGMLQKRLHYYVAPVTTKAKSGASIDTIGTIPPNIEFILAQYSTPPAGYRIYTLYDSNYVHLLFGLRERDIGVIQGSFVHFILSTMKQLERCWKEIVYDIGHGSINPDINLPSDVRAKLTEELAGGDPERAEELTREFRKGFHGIMRRVWPKISGVFAIDSTGVWSQLEEIYARGLPLLSTYYGCSEASIAIGLEAKYTEGMVCLIRDVVIEFIKVEQMDDPSPKTYFVDEVEVGQCYEVVVTQPNGLYRYRLGDVIRVSGFYENTPVVEFMYRTGMMLNLGYEKMDQRVVKESIAAAVDKWPDASLTEFAVAESTLLSEECSVFERDELMPYYLIFVELQFVAGREKVVLSEEEKQMIDDELKSRNSDYQRLRREKAISAPRIHIVKPGTFEELRDYLLENTNTSAIQYKSPRKLRTLPMVEVMINHIAK